MTMNAKRLMLKMVSENLAKFSPLKSVLVPDSGWVSSIRQSLNMTMEQLGRKLNVSRQAISQLEIRESEGSLTLKGLRDVANALDLQLVYGLVPKNGTLEEYVERKAFELARETLLGANQQMRLEAQAVDNEELKRAITETAEELVRNVDRQLWD